MTRICELEGCELPVKENGKYCCPEHASIAVSMRAAGIRTQAEYWAEVNRMRRCPCCGRMLPTSAFRTASADHYSLRLAVTCKDCRASGKYRAWRAKQSGEVSRRHERKVIGDDGKARTIHVLSGFLGPALFAGQVVEPRPHGEAA